MSIEFIDEQILAAKHDIIDFTRAIKADSTEEEIANWTAQREAAQRRLEGFLSTRQILAAASG